MSAAVEIVEIRAYEPESLEQLAELLVDAVESGASVGFLPPLSKDEAVNYWKSALEPGIILWAAKLDRTIVGTVQLQLAQKKNAAHRAEIAKLMVHTRSRRNGIARALMQAAEERARAENRTLLVLDTRAGDPSNLLYRSLGYVEAGRIPRYARSADGSLNDTVFYYKETEA
ncbi:GNAT family N-acetyltransferase [Paenibacillus oleatilyticus]|uniref:GNAT family N-acetyltransferase n=1 Tax=Paenibacillus oleatilyticus TaxID=2594886 RepID=UPI001C1F2ED6|nr:GNAT family N-acetyltransferase [Paenibacillus oleatilyticus]MBU7315621.1 GNAT family N-acetyltransferase [Paenibacillus oleatilyticus]